MHKAFLARADRQCQLQKCQLSTAQPNVDEALRDLHARGVEAVGCAAHVGSLPDLQRLAGLARDTYGRVDVLVSNAAVNPSAGLILDMPDSAIDKILEINVKAAITLTREVRPLLHEVRLHNNSSGQGEHCPACLVC